MKFSFVKWRIAMMVFVCLLASAVGAARLHGQENAGTIHGSVVDPQGQAVSGATVVVATAARVERTAVSTPDGKFTVTGLPAGTYSVEVTATGFATQVRHGVAVGGGATAEVPVSLTVASVSEEVTVEAEADPSIASQLSPVKALLDAGSARTEITSELHSANYTSPVTDFSDITQAAPGTVTWSVNGIGDGQVQ